MTYSTRTSRWSAMSPSFELHDVIGADDLEFLGTVRCRDVKAVQGPSSTWLAFKGQPSLGRATNCLGEFASLALAASAVAASAS
ncbi:hypothetical protein [Caulobacter rhizosphaerae]|uniref:hypothetical protein n=1 Tax=Caulobacter rhizosphaerae TaxID=2010972 RepID=UPI0013D1B688|nr:hypothetical protein [Caulobacter rhizosphaerae]GGL48527.1 hypothetical protein GCM10010983_52340 [Caulobacter rhizosphaerae]